MPKKVIIIFFLVVLLQTAFGQTIMDIQQTTIPGDNNTYPSTYLGQEVTIGPITIGVKGFNGSDNNMFAFDLNPNQWNGIYLNNATNTVNIKAMVSVTGTVSENNGMTELTNATVTIINPGPIDVTANLVKISDLEDLAIAEKYESSLVKINNLVFNGDTEDDYWFATDADNKEIRVGKGFFDSNPNTGEIWDSIMGILVYDGTNFVLHPRNAADLVTPHPSNIEILTQFEKIGDQLYLHFNADRKIMTTYLATNGDDFGINSFKLNLDFDKQYLSYNGYRVDNIDLSPEYTIYPEINDENIILNYSSGNVFSSNEAGATLTMIFDLKEFGFSSLKVNNFSFASSSTGEEYQKILNQTISYNNNYDSKKAYLSILNANNAKNIFNPYQNERITIKYGFKQGFSTKTIVRIYDLKGRLIYTPVNKVHSGLGDFSWDGRDRNRELVDIGTYICQVEVVVRETGAKYTTDQPIVVAGQLK